MATIVRFGPADPLWKREFPCIGCGSTVEVTREDLWVQPQKVPRGVMLDGDPLHEVMFQCPCGCQNLIVRFNNAPQLYGTDKMIAQQWAGLPLR